MTVQALRLHRAEVLDDLLATYGPELQGVAYLILRDRSAAEDVVIDTLLTALERGDQLRDADALRPWLLRIAVNRALSTRRGSARIVQLDLAPDRPARSTDDDLRLALLASVGRLAPRMRAAVVLRYYADLSVRDVAVALGTSENTSLGPARARSRSRTHPHTTEPSFVGPAHACACGRLASSR